MTALHETLDPIQLQRRQFLGRKFKYIISKHFLCGNSAKTEEGEWEMMVETIS